MRYDTTNIQQEGTITLLLKTISLTIKLKCIVMDFYQVLEKRRTIRDFSDKEVTEEVLERVLSAAFKAPTNDHLRQFEFIVVRGQENIARLISQQ